MPAPAPDADAPITAGSAAGMTDRGHHCGRGKRGNLRTPRNRPSPPSTPQHAQTPPDPPSRPSRSRPHPIDRYRPMLTRMGLARALEASTKMTLSRKAGPWCFRATLRQCKGWRNDSQALEHERGRRSKTRQQRGGGIEDRPAADVARDRAIEHARPMGARPTTATSRPPSLS